jgi:hypothetical protein
MTTVDADLAAALGRDWEDGWNACDVDRIMTPFADDVVFSSPFVSRLTGGAAETIDGYDALRTYVADALRRAPGIGYKLDATFVGSDTVVLVYTCHFPDGTHKTGADTMRVDAGGKVVDWRSHYSFDPVEVDHIINS